MPIWFGWTGLSWCFSGLPIESARSAERSTTRSLEQLRNHYDRGHHGLILIGMPGIEKRFVRYPQLNSRVGFAPLLPPLSHDELISVPTTGAVSR